MADTDPILCPECGWSGTEADLEAGESCPVCDADIEIVD